jgi:hypothetical protein
MCATTGAAAPQPTSKADDMVHTLTLQLLQQLGTVAAAALPTELDQHCRA